MATKLQCLGMIDEINEFSVFGEMLQSMGQTGHHQVDCSRVAGRQWQMSDRRQWHIVTGGLQEDWKSTSAGDLGVSSADQRRTAADPTSTPSQKLCLVPSLFRPTPKLRHRFSLTDAFASVQMRRRWSNVGGNDRTSTACARRRRRSNAVHDVRTPSNVRMSSIPPWHWPRYGIRCCGLLQNWKENN